MNNDFTIRIGPIRIAIAPISEHPQKTYYRYLCDGIPHFSVAITPDDLRLELEICQRADVFEGKPPQIYHRAFLESLAIQRKITERLFEYNILLFHGSAVAVDGQTYLFIAVSGTGKSTHAALWRQLLGDRAVMVNDDKPFIEIREDGIIVHGSPWNGVHKLGNNISVPLKAICILERGQTNKIEKISFKESLFMLLQQSSRPAKNIEKYMELIEQFSDNISFYRMECNTDLEAAQIAYEAMSE